jgi:fibronectin-binding autotransporter adhesin
MGGAIFVMQGGSLTVTGTLTINGNTVAPGTASGAAVGGSAFGSGLFLHGDGHLLFEPAAGELQVIDDEISDMTGMGGIAPDVGSWFVLKTGAGTLQLAGTNTFTGGVFVFDGALRLSPGPSPIGSGRLTLHGAVVRPSSPTDFTNPITLGSLGAPNNVFDLSDITGPWRATSRGRAA